MDFPILYVGFICPVHTPDGAPCGLLNHLTMNCIVTKHPDPKLENAIPSTLLDLGMLPISIADNWNNCYTVILDGRVIGLVEENIVSRVVDKLRILKICEKVRLTKSISLKIVSKFYLSFIAGSTNNGNSFDTKEKCSITIPWSISFHRACSHDETREKFVC